MRLVLTSPGQRSSDRGAEGAGTAREMRVRPSISSRLRQDLVTFLTSPKLELRNTTGAFLMALCRNLRTLPAGSESNDASRALTSDSAPLRNPPPPGATRTA